MYMSIIVVLVHANSDHCSSLLHTPFSHTFSSIFVQVWRREVSTDNHVQDFHIQHCCCYRSEVPQWEKHD